MKYFRNSSLAAIILSIYSHQDLTASSSHNNDVDYFYSITKEYHQTLVDKKYLNWKEWDIMKGDVRKLLEETLRNVNLQNHQSFYEGIFNIHDKVLTQERKLEDIKFDRQDGALEYLQLSEKFFKEKLSPGINKWAQYQSRSQVQHQAYPQVSYQQQHQYQTYLQAPYQQQHYGGYSPIPTYYSSLPPAFDYQATPPRFSPSVHYSPTENAVKDWLAQTRYTSLKIDIGDLKPNSCISYFGTKELGFDRNNHDSNGFAWLSNYYVANSHNPNSNQVFDFKIKTNVGNREYEASNVEVFYQMFKLFLDPNQQQKDYHTFKNFSPDEARNEARNKKLRPAGNNFRKLDQYMEHLIEQKFFNNNSLAQSLLKTGDKFLFEGNKWGDARFGMSYKEGTLEGENKLGKMLMKTRAKLQSKKDSDINFANFVNNPVTTYQAWASVKPTEDF